MYLKSEITKLLISPQEINSLLSNELKYHFKNTL